ncbi:MAG: protein kinase [Polyangiaceae bacterium]|nr:protein kinase [Polyangiaceae bacterium]
MSLVSPSNPSRLGRYEIVGLLATGGMAEVHLGRFMGPSGFERVVVVKRILPHLAREEAFVDMFLDEARIVAKINHPNVIQVSELGRDGDELFLVMEFVEGESLGGFMRRHWANDRAIGVELAAFLVAEMCAGLHAAHELRDEDGRSQEIVHRDVSPQNVMITYGGKVKVLDFGIAKAVDRSTRTKTGTVKGKVEYMSPEQCRALHLDRRSDVFSLGVLLFELTTGKRLFRRRSEFESLRAVSEDPIPPPTTLAPDYPVELERIVMRALARPVDERFATAEDMRRAILGYLRTTPDAGMYDEVLARRMQELFADRLELKNAMLRRVRAGSDVTRLPPPEVDLGVEAPVVPTAVTLAEKPARTVVDRAEPTHVAPVERSSPDVTPSRAWKPVAMVGLVAALTALGWFGFSKWSRSASSHDAEAKAANETPVPASRPEPGAASSTETVAVVPASDASVEIEITTTPAGAQVFVDGKERGTTPTKVSFTRGDASVDVELRLEGYETRTEKVVPNVAQRLALSMSPAVRFTPIRRATPSATAAPSAAASSKYRKFN